MFVIELQHPLDHEDVGAKAANLARTADMGLSVPPGVVVTRQALGLFLERSGLFPEARRLIDDVEPEDTARADAYQALCAEVLRAPIPEPVVEAVTSSAQVLLDESSHGLVVRSSGVHEDSVTASFAGVYESFLGIRTKADLWEAVRRCWCASWAPQAIDYARRMGIRPAADGMGVLLQRLVRADSAGVLFTADPLTGNPWRFVLESSFGLARDLVASTGATPRDRFVIEWDTGDILERHVAEKRALLVPGTPGLDTVDVPADRRTEPSLSDDLATRIAQKGLLIDRAFETRVDVEWVVEGDDIHIVQVRPIAALPEFFPHSLPAHLAERTWSPAKVWHFPLGWMLARPLRDSSHGKVMLPIYRDKMVIEMFNRYLQVEPVEVPDHRRCDAELDFHGYRYLIYEGEEWPYVPLSRQEQYLIEYEPRLRADFLRNASTRLPAIEQRAERLRSEAKTLEPAIDAILWTREEMWDQHAFSAGPSQYLHVTCLRLLRAFVDEHLPDIDVNDLTLGHHAELDPYAPHALMAEAEEMAELLESERERFSGMSVGEFAEVVHDRDVPLPFIAALEDYCYRVGLEPPPQSHLQDEAPQARGVGRERMGILRLVRNALRGERRISQVAEAASGRRDSVVAEIRKSLASRPAEWTRFVRLHDWALFWGSALNHRILRMEVPFRKLGHLFREMQRVLLEAGLGDDIDDVVYFTVDDLRVIAATGDIAAGRRVLRKRRLEYERCDRLAAPPLLGKAPGKNPTATADAAPDAGRAEEEMGTAIPGKPGGPGCSEGFVRRVDTLADGDDVGGTEDVVVLTRPVWSNNNDVPLLFSMMLRVRGLVVTREMWLGSHIGQTARECGVPIVRIDPADLERLVEGRRVEVDGTRGRIRLVDA